MGGCRTATYTQNHVNSLRVHHTPLHYYSYPLTTLTLLLLLPSYYSYPLTTLTLLLLLPSYYSYPLTTVGTVGSRFSSALLTPSVGGNSERRGRACGELRVAQGEYFCWPVARTSCATKLACAYSMGCRHARLGDLYGAAAGSHTARKAKRLAASTE